MYTNTASDRVQVVGRGELLHPGACALCGSGNCDEGYVNTGVYYDYEGQVYFCIPCTRQIAEVIGCLLPEEANILREQANAALTSLRKAQEELSDKSAQLHALDLAVSALPNLSALLNGNGVPDVPSESDSVNVDAEVTSGSDDSESGATESVTLSRRSDSKRDELRNGSSPLEL